MAYQMLGEAQETKIYLSKENKSFYKNIEAEICEILRIFSKNKPDAEILKGI